ncbi:MAG: hypothetical protein JO219_11670 [Candidatus Eremiobacteraeota bacterium]|nr:hypothetical protein [Candidatus Eremiobacteraeota bacterium]
MAAAHDYETFARKELALRRELRYPPFGRLAYIGVSGTDLRATATEADKIAQVLRRDSAGVEVLGPAPDPLPKARGEHRARIALKSATLDALLDACTLAQSLHRSRETRVTTVVDPR